LKPLADANWALFLNLKKGGCASRLQVDLRREVQLGTLQFLSRPFAVCHVDLQQRLDAGGAAGDDAGKLWEHDETIDVAVTAAGVWNGIAFWCPTPVLTLTLTLTRQAVGASIGPHHMPS
jgi:hypothetical protein